MAVVETDIVAVTGIILITGVSSDGIHLVSVICGVEMLLSRLYTGGAPGLGPVSEAETCCAGAST